MARNQTLAQRLGKVSVFRRLSMDQLNTLSAAGRGIDLAPREALYQQGEGASSCFVVLKGAVQFRVTLGYCAATAGLAFENDIFGLEALRGRGKRQDSAIGAGPVKLLEIGNSALKSVLMENPRCELDLLNYLVAKLHEKTEYAVRNSHQDAERRIAAYLIDRSGARPPRNGSPDVTLSQAELADYLALTPETFCRKVNKFRQLGWISGSGNEYVITQPDALRDLIGG